MEMIIYLGLFSILMGGAVVATYQLLQGGTHNETAVSIQEEGTFLIRKINWTLTGASSASATNLSTLSISKPDGTTDTISADGKAMYISHSSSGNMPIQLNSDVFAVSNVNFTVVPATSDGKPAEVDASFTVQEIPFVFKRYLR